MTEIISKPDLEAENQHLRAQLAEMEETLQAIRTGQVDALVVVGENGEQVYTLKGAEYPYRVLIENINEGALTMSAEGLILYCNRHFAAMLETPLEQVIGTRFKDWIPENENSVFQALLPGNGVLRRGELSLLTSDGQPLPAYISVSTLHEEGAPPLFCLVVTDLSEQKRNESILASLNLFQAILEQAADVIIICDEYEVIIRASQPTHILCGFNPLGRLFGDVFHLDWGVGLPYQISKVQASKSVRSVEATLATKRGNLELLVSIARLQVEQGQKPGFVVTFTDITSLKKAEVERDRLLGSLERQNQELEARVSERTIELEQRMLQLRLLVNELTYAEQRERRRMAQVLHDHLQQVIFAARLSVQVAYRQATLASVRDLLTQADGQLDDAFKTSRSLALELSPPVYQNQNVTPAIQWLATNMLEQFGLHVDVQTDKSITITSEPLRLLLLQGVRELLFNVVKHAGVQEAELFLSRVDEQTIEVRVQDHGVGFNPASVRSAEVAGGSFGVFSLQQRLAAIGGSLHLDSVPGRGTKATIHIAWREAESIEGDSDAPGLSSGVAVAKTLEKSRIRIMLVDDHTVVRQSLSQAIGIESDMQVVGEAGDGQQAVNMVAELKPDVIIMDVNMPLKNGVEATREILLLRPEIVVIVLTMYESDGHAAAMIKAGAAAYVTKMSPIKVLLETVRWHYQRRSEANL